MPVDVTWGTEAQEMVKSATQGQSLTAKINASVLVAGN